jgi:phosphatidylinositol alpha-mannosyltransferase
MKICIVSDAYYPYPSGVSEYTFYLAKYLRRRGHKVKILTTNYPNERGIEGKEFEEDVIRIGRVFFLRANKSYATPTIGLGVSRIVKEFLNKENFDILQLHTPLLPPSLSFYSLLASKTANIAVFHSATFRIWSFGKNIFRKFFKEYQKKIIKLVAVSPSARDCVLSYVPGDYKIIPCGVDIERFNDKVKPKEKFLKNSNYKILFLGRLDRRKGLPELLKAFSVVKNKLKDAILIVAGRGPLEKKCKKLARKLKIENSVFFEGFIPENEVPSYYSSCDVYCSPAIGGESFGIVLLEAMACKKPVLASRIKGYDFIIKDGFNGIFFNPQDPKDIAKKIIKILKDKNLREKISKNAFSFAKEYSWEKIAGEYEKVYIEAISEFKKAKKN